MLRSDFLHEFLDVLDVKNGQLVYMVGYYAPSLGPCARRTLWTRGAFSIPFSFTLLRDSWAYSCLPGLHASS